MQGVSAKDVAGELSDVSVVVVTYNSAGTVGELAETLRELAKHGAKVIVIDNASRDGTVEFLRRATDTLTMRAVIVELRHNVGFAAACNIAAIIAERLGTRYLLFLNPDVRVMAGSVIRLRRLLDSSDMVAGCVLLSEKGRIDSLGGYVDAALSPGELLHGFGLGLLSHLRRIRAFLPSASACMACAMVPLSLFKRIGPLDWRMFVYFEDVEFSLRAWSHGMPVVVDLAAVAVHGRGKGVRRDARTEILVRYYSARNPVVLSLRFWGSPVPVGQIMKVLSSLLYSIVTRNKLLARSVIDGIIIGLHGRPRRLPRGLVLEPPNPRHYILFWVVKALLRGVRSVDHLLSVASAEVGKRFLLRVLRGLGRS